VPERDVLQLLLHGPQRRLTSGRVAEVEDVAKAYLQLMDQDYATGTVTVTVTVIDGGTILV
jgi:hypothetical protein